MMIRAGHMLFGFALFTLMWGCTVGPKKFIITDTNEAFPENTIIATQSETPVAFDEMLHDLQSARIIYVGENHRNTHHHQFQLKILKAMHASNPNLIVGMEMFDRTYQPVLDQWSKGVLDQDEFIRKSHWYANWKYDYALYKDILEFIRNNHIRLVGLNIPFHIPSKIAIGGIDNLLPDDKKHLPQHIDTSNASHREYVREIFGHHHIRGKENFEYFYAAQCVWEDIMAESIAQNLDDDANMLVLLGNGHIINKYGVPDRAFVHTHTPFRTIYLSSVGAQAKMTYGDYIWVGPAVHRRR
jgi:uncharacterized iron-regulated protein